LAEASSAARLLKCGRYIHQKKPHSVFIANYQTLSSSDLGMYHRDMYSSYD
jgi:hypothetical protein